VAKDGKEIADIACDGDYTEIDMEAVRAAGVREAPSD